jgi:hypothetical protein
MNDKALTPYAQDEFGRVFSMLRAKDVARERELRTACVATLAHKAKVDPNGRTDRQGQLCDLDALLGS